MALPDDYFLENYEESRKEDFNDIQRFQYRTQKG
jgi:hypothetical protein